MKEQRAEPQLNNVLPELIQDQADIESLSEKIMLTLGARARKIHEFNIFPQVRLALDVDGLYFRHEDFRHEGALKIAQETGRTVFINNHGRIFYARLIPQIGPRVTLEDPSPKYFKIFSEVKPEDYLKYARQALQAMQDLVKEHLEETAAAAKQT